MVARFYCEEHGWDFGEVPMSVTTTTLCPVGIIEKAVNDGVARLEKVIREARSENEVGS